MSKKRKVYIHVGLPGGPGDFLEMETLRGVLGESVMVTARRRLDSSIIDPPRDRAGGNQDEPIPEPRETVVRARPLRLTLQAHL